MKQHTAFIFPGQGSQYEGMGTSFRDDPTAKPFFEVYTSLMDYSFVDLSANELSSTQITQPALFTMSCIHFALLKKQNISPQCVAGHSLGEYSALYAAGVFSFEQGLELVAYRGFLMHEASLKNSGTMAAIIGLSHEKVSLLCDQAQDTGIVEAVNINSDKQIVVSGTHQAVETVCQKAKDLGAKRAILLPVSAPFHSSLMRQIREKFKQKIDSIPFKKAELMVVQNVDACVHQDPHVIKQNLISQLYSPVQWVSCMQELQSRGAESFIECGPGKVLSALARSMSYKASASEDLLDFSV
jgi:[acyl-carrier-protein] S-malonyltransferase